MLLITVVKTIIDIIIVLSKMTGLSLLAILSYVRDKVRCLREGVELLEARHIIKCGWKDTGNQSDSAGTYTILAFCLKTSALAKDPHELEITIT